MTYQRPDTINAALNLIADGNWTILAGGTDVFPASADTPPPEHLLDITNIAELKEIRADNDGLRIGALATWSELISVPLPPAFDGLKAAASEVGSIQIQNRATIVGNLCNASPAADGMPPLLTLDAHIELCSPAGKRTLPLSDFIHGNRRTALNSGELATALIIPKSAQQGLSGFYKLGTRKYLVISIAMAAIRLVFDKKGSLTEAALAIGACSEVAQRCENQEAALIGATDPNDAIDRVDPALFDHLSPITDVRADADFRSEAIAEIVRRVIRKTYDAARG